MKNTNVIRLMILLLILAGCAVGKKYTYQNVNADITMLGTSTVAVATHDRRVYVQNGNKQTDFVGLQREGAGNPMLITTASGNSLAQDFTETIARSLASKGFQATPVSVNYADTADSVKAVLMNTGAHRLLLLTLYEWKSDTSMYTVLMYDASLEVLDENGKTVAQKSISGRDDLGGSALNPSAYAKKAVPAAFKGKIEILLNDNEVSKALE